MAREVVKLTNWPFKKGEKAKLVWIAEPFRKNNKWMVNAFFKGDKFRKEITMDWANIHFLVMDKYYVDGNLNNGEDVENNEVIDINLSNAEVEYNEEPWEVWVGKNKFKTKYKYFKFKKDNSTYVIPIIEVIRAILAPNRFLLNRILEMDTLENYFVYEIEGNTLSIHFTSQYNKALLKSERINHLAWLLTNPNAFRMFNIVGQSVRQREGLKLDFLLEKFSIRARIKRHKEDIKILEVVGLKRKRIHVEEINIYHPSLEETEASGEVKKRKYIGKGIDGKIDLTSDANGSTNAFDEVNTLLIDHEYEFLPYIKKCKTGRKIRRDKEDETTKAYIIDSGNIRTTADEGGQDLIKGLEFKTLDSVVVKGELEEFIEVLKLLEKRSNIKKVEIIVGELPDGRKFSRLKDGKTRRKYAIGKMVFINNIEFSLVEVEREDKLLSMLIIKSNNIIKWNYIYGILLNGLTDGSGKWNTLQLEENMKLGLNIFRIKHIKRSIFIKEQQIYVKLVNLL